MLQSQISCHNFLCLSQPRPFWNWLMEKRDMPKELGLFYAAFLTVRLYIQLDQFIIFQITLPTLYHEVPSNFMLVLKRLHMKLLNIVNFLTLKVVLGYHHTRLTKILTIFNSKLSRSKLIETRMFCPNCLWTFKTNSLSNYSSAFWSFLYHRTKTNSKKRTLGRSPRKYSWIGRALPYLSLDQGN